jgi:RNA polymerase sigma-70 factor (ECF subfamily)
MERVVRACLPGLLRAARAAGLTEARAEDAVANSLLVFVERAADFDGRARPCTWIHGILVRTIWKERLELRREAAHDELEEVVDSRFDAAGRWRRPPAGPLEQLLRGEMQRELADCLAGLPERQRLAFTLRELEGFDTAELCKILDVSANNLGVLLHRARHALRDCLEAKGFAGSSDAAL